MATALIMRAKINILFKRKHKYVQSVEDMQFCYRVFEEECDNVGMDLVMSMLLRLRQDKETCQTANALKQYLERHLPVLYKEENSHDQGISLLLNF